MENSGKKMQRSDFPKILHKSLNATLLPSIISKSFESCGLYPFDEDAIDYSKLLKQVTERKSITASKNNTCTANKDVASSKEIQLDLLDEVEAHLTEEVLNQFRNVGSEIELEERFVELYKFWKNIRNEKDSHINDASILQKNMPSNLDQTITDIHIDEEFWLNDDEIVEATLKPNGSLGLANLNSPSTSKQFEDEKTPVKKTDQNTEQSKYPTPFKNALFWPGNSEKRKATTDDDEKMKKTKVYPTVAISDEFMEHQRRVNAQKVAKEKTKLDRAQKRKEKIHQNILKGKTKGISKSNNTAAEEKIDYPNGDFVVVEYEGEYFPGIVIEKVDDNLKVKTMTMSGNFWKWPDKDDILVYDMSEIKCKIESPALISSRGTYDVPKINELRKKNNA
ncbi:hypothetical protein WA026_021682 [Henosepilachna vigintioctopunctata]